ncbi:hypothetical protein D3C87_1857660 [compost metagenome]
MPEAFSTSLSATFSFIENRGSQSLPFFDESLSAIRSNDSASRGAGGGTEPDASRTYIA